MTNDEIKSYEAGRARSHLGMARALAWQASQSNTIGYPYQSAADAAKCLEAFKRGVRKGSPDRPSWR